MLLSTPARPNSAFFVVVVADVAWLRESHTSEWPGTRKTPDLNFPSSSLCLHDARIRHKQPGLDLELSTLTQFTSFASLLLCFPMHLTTQPTVMESFISYTPDTGQAPEDQERLRHTSTVLRIYSLW